MKKVIVLSLASVWLVIFCSSAVAQILPCEVTDSLMIKTYGEDLEFVDRIYHIHGSERALAFSFYFLPGKFSFVNPSPKFNKFQFISTGGLQVFVDSLEGDGSKDEEVDLFMIGLSDEEVAETERFLVNLFRNPTLIDIRGRNSVIYGKIVGVLITPAT